MDVLRSVMNKYLYEIWDNEDFILGINGTIRNDYALAEMITYLEENQGIE